jgi:hypothetical protein
VSESVRACVGACRSCWSVRCFALLCPGVLGCFGRVAGTRGATNEPCLVTCSWGPVVFRGGECGEKPGRGAAATRWAASWARGDLTRVGQWIWERNAM